MISIYEIRKSNVRKLAKVCGSISAFAKQIDRAPTQVSRFLGKNATRNIGDKLARHIEHSFCLPKYWLDLIQHQVLDSQSLDKEVNTLNLERYTELHRLLSVLANALEEGKINDECYQLLKLAVKKI